MTRTQLFQFLPSRRRMIAASLFVVAVGALYVLSIVWRASCAEHYLFGRSDLIPLSLHKRGYEEFPTPASFGNGTYRFERNGQKIVVYKQLINSFQHAYGSALASFELGEVAADLLFRANEYVEAVCSKDRGTRKHFLDTKKDLANNAVGRDIGLQARALHLSGQAADEYIRARVLGAQDSGVVVNHYLSPRVSNLPSPEESGCPGLKAP